MVLSSPAFTNFHTIPEEYTCKGSGQSPPLEIQDVPANTKSLAITLIDPDAPGGTFTHWVIWNISGTATKIQPGEAPFGAIQGVNSRKKNGYAAPCPPDKSVHQYQFSLYALDTRLSIGEKSSRETLEEAIKAHILAQAELVGQYGRE